MVKSVFRTFIFLSLLQSPLTWADDFVQPQWAEDALLQVFQSINEGKLTQANAQLEELTDTLPNYKLAQLVKAEILLIQSGNYQQLAKLRKKHQKRSKSLLQEAQVRYQSKVQQNNELIEHYVVKANQEPYLLLIDTDANRLHLYRQTMDGYHAMADYYVSIGRKGTGKRIEGDLKTPIGVYHINAYLDDTELPELYGVGALTLDYPNVWDKKKGRTGSGIWLHGTPRSTYSREPLASRGCVVLNNPQMSTLIEDFQLPSDTPVLIVNSQQEMTSFSVSEMDRLSLLTQVQQRLNSEITIDWKAVSIFRYPGEKDHYWVSFNQNRQKRHQVWALQSQGWQIVLDKVSGRPELLARR